ncbi:MAG TPA: VWA domain-containing protein [Phototrophicaceae bacterium]|nr:VWA domain-containing protein [Phototrophicaceae bacterium]
MTFVYPGVLLLLVVLPLAAVWLFRREHHRQIRWQQLGDAAWLKRETPASRSARRNWKSVLWLAAAALTALALARPLWGLDVDILETQGVSVMIVLDVSNSMNVQDVLPSRLERARLGLRRLLAGLTGHEVGLILFAGDAFVQFPLTTDLSSAETFLKAASSQSVTRQGTALEKALRLAIAAFNQRRVTRQMIIVVSDGENFDGDPLNAAAEAADAGITIDAVGYGETQGEPVPVLDAAGNVTGYKSAASGDVVLSALNEAGLRALAERTGGTYQHANAEGTEMEDLIKRIQQMGGGPLANRVQSRSIERFEIFVVLALLLLSLEIALPLTRRKSV